MQKTKKNTDKQNQMALPVDWHGLGNEPRNENLARIRGPGSFEKQEIDREKESEPDSLYRFHKHMRRDSRR